MARHRMRSSDLDLYRDYNSPSSRRYNRAEAASLKAAADEPFGEENKERAMAMAGAGLTSAVVAGAAGYYQGMNGGMPTLAGFGYDVWGAGLLWLGGLFGVKYLGKSSNYIVAAGTGLASFAAGSYGAQMGIKARLASMPAPQPGVVAAAPQPQPLPTATHGGGAGAGGWNYRGQRVPVRW